MKRWAEAKYPREQAVLFTETLDEVVGEHHPVRVLDALLKRLDWSKWEGRYDGHRGQPAIHPRLVAGAILYGLLKRIRSSRDLEEATRERLDFRWFLEGRTIDHSTFAGFRTAFESELKELSEQISEAVICRSTESCLVELILDGTRVRANSDRNGARRAECLEKMVQACAESLAEKLQTLSEGDLQEKELESLRARIESLKAERDKYAAALSEAKHRDKRKRGKKGKKARAVRVPVTDPESTVLPNKEGGFAPNYTPTVAVESGGATIVCADVVQGGDEASAVQRLLDDRERQGKCQPERLIGDSGFAAGETLQELEQRGIQAYMPAGGDRRECNPANRADARLPVAQASWERLPREGERLGRNAFIYDSSSDVYYCPMGQALKYYRTGKQNWSGVVYRAYRCPGGAGCPLAGECLKGKTKRRTVIRDQYQASRDRVDIRMASEKGQRVYSKRARTVERVFGYIKGVLGIRQFLHRGLKKVRMEWRWICTAYNLRKLLRLLTKGPESLRQALANGAATPDSLATPLGTAQDAFFRLLFRFSASRTFSSSLFALVNCYEQ